MWFGCDSQPGVQALSVYVLPEKSQNLTLMAGEHRAKAENCLRRDAKRLDVKRTQFKDAANTN
jgi:hypothetical protein